MQFFSLFLSLNLSPNSQLKMDTTLEKLKKYLPQNAITKIYCARCESVAMSRSHKLITLA